MCQALPLRAAEPVYDAASYFSAGENPAGEVWSWRGKWSGKNNLGRDGNYALLPELLEIPFPPDSDNDEAGWGPQQPSADGLFLPAVWRYQGAELPDPFIVEGNHYRARPGVLLTHPGSARLVAVTWQAPRSGTISLAAQFQDAVTGNPAIDTGVSWFIQLRRETPLATGDLGPGGTSPLLERSNLTVKQGDLVHFGIDPRGNLATDTTAVIARVSYGPSATPSAEQLLDAPLPSASGGGIAALRQLPGGNQTLRYGGGANDFVVLQGDTDVTDYPVVSGGVTTNYVASGTLAYDQALRYDLSGATVNLKGGTVVSFRYWSSTNTSVPGYVISGTLSSTATAQSLPYGYEAGYTMTFQPGSRIEFGNYKTTTGITANGYVLKGYASTAQPVYFSYLAGGLNIQAGSECSFHHSPTNGSARSGYLKVAWPASDTFLPYSYTAGLNAKVRAGVAAVFRHFKSNGSQAAGYLESGVLAENGVLLYGTGVSLTAKIDTPVSFTFSTPGSSLVASYEYVRDCIPVVNSSVRFGSQAGASVTILANKSAKFSRPSLTSQAGYLDYGVLAPPGPVTVPYNSVSPIRLANLAANQPAAFARVSATNGTGFLTSGILSGAQTIYTSTSTTDGMTLVVTNPGTSTVTTAPPPITDQDGGGFSETEENQMGTSDSIYNDPHSEGNPQTWSPDVQARTLVVRGDLAMDQEKSDSKTVTIPAGSGTWLLVRAIKSEEFPRWTRQASVFNDTVSWSASGALTIPAGTPVGVNSLHSNWVAVLFWSCAHVIAGPIISNIRCTQVAGTKRVEMRYDVRAPGAAVVKVKVEISANAGSSYAVPVSSLSGAVGLGVPVGLDRLVVWEAGRDWNQQFSEQMRVRITADDAPRTMEESGMVLIQGGTFTMGDGLDGMADAPQHAVTLSTYWLARIEVTKSLWDDLAAWGLARDYQFERMGLGEGVGHPVTGITWLDAVTWCNARSEKEGLRPVYYDSAAFQYPFRRSDPGVSAVAVDWTANGYRLPTEAEWERAARGNFTGRRFHRGDRLNATEANYLAQTSSTFEFIPAGYVKRFDLTAPAGSYEPGAYGLCDMMGNAREWVWDWWSPPPGYGTGPVTNPRGTSVGTRRVLRGGAWNQTAAALRLARRDWLGTLSPEEGQNAGFRPARSVP